MILPAKAKNREGQIESFELEDSVLDYAELFKKFPEVVCLEAVQKIKQNSGKKCAIIFGNCQTDKILKMLMNHMQFRREYFFVRLLPIYACTKEFSEYVFGGGGGNFYNLSISSSHSMLVS